MKRSQLKMVKVEDIKAEKPLPRLYDFHVEVLGFLKRGKKFEINHNSDPVMIRFERCRTWWNIEILEELRQHKLINADNQLTVEGELWLLMNN